MKRLKEFFLVPIALFAIRYLEKRLGELEALWKKGHEKPSTVAAAHMYCAWAHSLMPGPKPALHPFWAHIDQGLSYGGEYNVEGGSKKTYLDTRYWMYHTAALLIKKCAGTDAAAHSRADQYLAEALVAAEEAKPDGVQAKLRSTQFKWRGV